VNTNLAPLEPRTPCYGAVPFLVVLALERPHMRKKGPSFFVHSSKIARFPCKYGKPFDSDIKCTQIGQAVAKIWPFEVGGQNSEEQQTANFARAIDEGKLERRFVLRHVASTERGQHGMRILLPSEPRTPCYEQCHSCSSSPERPHMRKKGPLFFRPFFQNRSIFAYKTENPLIRHKIHPNRPSR